jgi:GxxExxY protein
MLYFFYFAYYFSEMTENEISYLIRGAIFKIDKYFGPGLLEVVYCAALAHELRRNNLKVQTQVEIPVFIDEEPLDIGFRIDILVEGKVIVEVKSVEVLKNIHHKQVLTYLKLTKLKLAILVNFNAEDIKQGIFRKVNNL